MTVQELYVLSCIFMKVGIMSFGTLVIISAISIILEKVCDKFTKDDK